MFCPSSVQNKFVAPHESTTKPRAPFSLSLSVSLPEEIRADKKDGPGCPGAIARRFGFTLMLTIPNSGRKTTCRIQPEPPPRL